MTPTVEGLSEYIEHKSMNKPVEVISEMNWDIEVAEPQEYYPVTSSQKRIYVQHQLKNAATAYNMPFIWNLNQEIDTNRFETALELLIKRHDSLRTTFEWMEGELVQKVHDQVPLKLEYMICEDNEIFENMRTFIQPFNLKIAPLFRIKMLKIASDRYVMLFDMHHIISDGVSINIFMEELMALYEGIELSPLRLQYKDVAVWQQLYRDSEDYLEHERYWLDIYRGEIPVLDLPTDYERPEIQSFAGDKVSIALDQGILQQLKRLSLQTRTTMYMILLSAYYILLAKYSGKEDIIVGTTIAGRNHPDMEGMIGVFVNALALRCSTNHDHTFQSLLAEVKEITLNAYKHQNYPFEELVDRLDIRRDVSRNPLFDTMFVFHNQMSKEVDGREREENINLNMSGDIGHHAIKFDLTLDAFEVNNTMHLTMEYCTDLYKKVTADMLLHYYKRILVSCIENPMVKISELEVLSTSEKQQVVSRINVNRELPMFEM